MMPREVDEDVLNVIAAGLPDDKGKMFFGIIKKYEEKLALLSQELTAARKTHADELLEKVEMKNKEINDLSFQLGQLRSERTDTIKEILLSKVEEKSKEVNDLSCQLERLKLQKEDLEERCKQAFVFPFLRAKIQIAEALYISPLSEVPMDYKPFVFAEDEDFRQVGRKLGHKDQSAEAEVSNSAFTINKINKHYKTWMFILDKSLHADVSLLRQRLKYDREGYKQRASSFCTDMSVLFAMSSPIIHQYILPFVAEEVISALSKSGVNTSLIESVEILLQQV